MTFFLLGEHPKTSLAPGIQDPLHANDYRSGITMHNIYDHIVLLNAIIYWQSIGRRHSSIL